MVGQHPKCGYPQSLPLGPPDSGCLLQAGLSSDLQPQPQARASEQLHSGLLLTVLVPTTTLSPSHRVLKLCPFGGLGLKIIPHLECTLKSPFQLSV